MFEGKLLEFECRSIVRAYEFGVEHHVRQAAEVRLLLQVGNEDRSLK